MATQYRGYTISHQPKPGPSSDHDWDFVRDDGPGDEDCGTAPSMADAKAQIDDQIEEASL